MKEYGANMLHHWWDPIDASSVPGDFLTWVQSQPSLDHAWKACDRGDWLLWLAGYFIGPPDSDERRPLVAAACACARQVLDVGDPDPTLIDAVATALAVAEAWSRADGRVQVEHVVGAGVVCREKAQRAAAVYGGTDAIATAVALAALSARFPWAAGRSAETAAITAATGRAMEIDSQMGPDFEIAFGRALAATAKALGNTVRHTIRAGLLSRGRPDFTTSDGGRTNNGSDDGRGHADAPTRSHAVRRTGQRTQPGDYGCLASMGVLIALGAACWLGGAGLDLLHEAHERIGHELDGWGTLGSVLRVALWPIVFVVGLVVVWGPCCAVVKLIERGEVRDREASGDE